jgi:hypothetical protein
VPLYQKALRLGGHYESRGSVELADWASVLFGSCVWAWDEGRSSGEPEGWVGADCDIWVGGGLSVFGSVHYDDDGGEREGLRGIDAHGWEFPDSLDDFLQRVIFACADVFDYEHLGWAAVFDDAGGGRGVDEFCFCGSPCGGHFDEHVSPAIEPGLVLA